MRVAQAHTAAALLRKNKFVDIHGGTFETAHPCGVWSLAKSSVFHVYQMPPLDL